MSLKEIAKKAGVSMITVSRVINTPEKVSKETRDKINAILTESGYIRNTAAHNLASNKSGIISVYASKTMEMLDPFFQQFLVGVGSALSEASYSLSLVNEVTGNEFCDGYILSGYNYSDTAFEQANKTGKPIALFGTISDPDVDCIDTDNVNSSKTIVEYLITKGHKRIAIILNTVDGDYDRERMAGYKKALVKHEIQYDEKLVHIVDNSIQGGMSSANWYVSNECDATAVFFITDLMAVGFIMGMQNLGYRIPEDISVVGFDGLGHHLLVSPRLTTIVQPVYEISRKLSKCLLNRIRNPETPPIKRLFEGKLLEEESVTTI